MPVTLSYPGVYVEELPSGVRTITGVATSITAFVGRAQRGPANRPVAINSFAEYERIFGGLWVGSSMSFAVRDFFTNGGSQALIVRVFAANAARAVLKVDTLELDAENEGAWGGQLRARVDYKVKSKADDPATPDPDLFNLTVRDGATGNLELFRNVAVKKDHPRRVDKVLAQESRLVRFPKYADGVVKPKAHADPVAGKTLWTDDAASSKVDDAAKGGDGDAEVAAAEFLKEGERKGIFALEDADLFNLLCLPPHKTLDDGGRALDTDKTVINAAIAYCVKRRAFLVIDPPSTWNDKEKAIAGLAAGDVGDVSNHAALYFPRLRQPNPLHDGQLEDFVPCGAVAGVMSRTDGQRGVWKAPAGLDALLLGVPELAVKLNDPDNGQLNPLGINCLRTLPAAGRVVWGARTRAGDDRLASEWKYVPVRRTALFIEESLYRGTQWVVFEPNDEPLWSQIRLNLGAFMHNLFRQGAFQGKTPREAYFVKCDKDTTTQNDINLGIVNIHVGFAPLKPAEFVVLKIQQMAGQIEG